MKVTIRRGRSNKMRQFLKEYTIKENAIDNNDDEN